MVCRKMLQGYRIRLGCCPSLLQLVCLGDGPSSMKNDEMLFSLSAAKNRVVEIAFTDSIMSLLTFTPIRGIRSSVAFDDRPICLLFSLVPWYSRKK